MVQVRFDLSICNYHGLYIIEGTGVPLCYVAFLFKVIGVYNPIIVFIESFCRVKKLSLTGTLLYHISDIFLVQWKQLANIYKKSRYIGDI